jgi:maleate isomerase
VGIILPSSNVVVEALIRERGASDAREYHTARIRVDLVNNDDGSQQQFALDRFLDAGALLVDAEVEVLVWAGTSGLWLGLDYDRRICDTLGNRFGIPTTTASIAFVEACRKSAVSRLGLLTPFLGEVQHRIVDVLAGENIHVPAEHHFGVAQSRRMADLNPAEIDAQIRALGRNVDAVGCVCTNMRVASSRFADDATKHPLVIDSARQCLSSPL